MKENEHLATHEAEGAIRDECTTDRPDLTIPVRRAGHRSHRLCQLRRAQATPIGIDPQLPASAACPVIKGYMRAIIAMRIDQFPEVARAVRILGLTELLRRIAGLAEIPTPQALAPTYHPG